MWLFLIHCCLMVVWLSLCLFSCQNQNRSKSTLEACTHSICPHFSSLCSPDPTSPLSLFSNLTHNALQNTLVSFSPIIDTLAPTTYLYSSPLNTFLAPLFLFAWQPAFFLLFGVPRFFFSLLSCRSAVYLFWPFSKLYSVRARYLHSTQTPEKGREGLRHIMCSETGMRLCPIPLSLCLWDEIYLV